MEGAPRVVGIIDLAELLKDLRAEHVDPAADGVAHKGLGLLRVVEDLVGLVADNTSKVLGEIPGHLRSDKRRKRKKKKERRKKKERTKKYKKGSISRQQKQTNEVTARSQSVAMPHLLAHHSGGSICVLLMELDDISKWEAKTDISLEHEDKVWLAPQDLITKVVQSTSRTHCLVFSQVPHRDPKLGLGVVHKSMEEGGIKEANKDDFTQTRDLTQI